MAAASTMRGQDRFMRAGANRRCCRIRNF
jgi:hypothetical protein